MQEYTLAGIDSDSQEKLVSIPAEKLPRCSICGNRKSVRYACYQGHEVTYITCTPCAQKKLTAIFRLNEHPLFLAERRAAAKSTLKPNEPWYRQKKGRKK